ncbi:MAG: cell division protein FtsA, partial [Armatimonadetes bacterium]|nr:cell division protein FtsA [Armatimonadota bacterium]
MTAVGRNYVSGLDVGTTKVCAVVARAHVSGQLEIVGSATVPSEGLKRGVVVDRQSAVAAIRRCIEQARQATDLPIARVFLGYTGGHISSVNVRGRTYVAGAQVTEQDVAQAIASARDAVALPADRRSVEC